MTSRRVDIRGGGEAASLQTQLEAIARPSGPPAPNPTASPSIADPIELFGHLEATRRFHRDTGLGRMFHPGRVSFRENLAKDSLHVVIHHDHISAHVDRVSPRALRSRPRRPPRYSLRRTAAHNLVGMAQDFLKLVRGRQGDHRSGLDCEWVWDPLKGVLQAVDLLDPEGSAWSVQMEAQVSGNLDEARLRDALTVVLGRQPTAGDLLWVVDCPDRASLVWARAQLQSRPAQVTDWPPLRAGLARCPDGDVFMLNVNHAAGDGYSALRLLGIIAATYTTGTGPDRRPDFPAARQLPVRPASATVSVFKGYVRSLEVRIRDVLAHPARLAPDGGRPEGAGSGFHLVCLSVDQTRRVVDPERPGTSRNILLAALHLALGDWNLQHGAPGRRIGVLVPVNLRPPSWPEELMGNFSVTARVSTNRRHRSGAVSALKAVTWQTTRNQRARTGIALLAGLERAGLLPLWSKQSLVVLQPLTRNRHIDTAFLANLGWVDQAPSFGDAGETIHLWFSLPARGPLTLCVGAVTIAGRLHLVLRYPHGVFSPDAARRFAEIFVARIADVAARRA